LDLKRKGKEKEKKTKPNLTPSPALAAHYCFGPRSPLHRAASNRPRPFLSRKRPPPPHPHAINGGRHRPRRHRLGRPLHFPLRPIKCGPEPLSTPRPSPSLPTRPRSTARSSPPARRSAAPIRFTGAHSSHPSPQVKSLCPPLQFDGLPLALGGRRPCLAAAGEPAGETAAACTAPPPPLCPQSTVAIRSKSTAQIKTNP
jgi:hypothetical protein